MTNFINKFISRGSNNSIPSTDVPASNFQEASTNAIVNNYTGDVINNNPVLNQTEAIERVVLSEHGFNLAARSAGDPNLLRSSLNRIYHGHLVDINQNENDQQAHKQQREKQLAELEKHRVDMEAEKNNIEKNYIPLKENELKQQKDKIHELKINKAEQDLLSEYKPFWFFTYSVLSVLMGLFLLFFYANVVYNAFFRNIISEVMNAGQTEIGALLNVIFTDKLFEQKLPVLFMSFLAAFLFFGFGLLPHKIKSDNRIQSKISKVILLVIAFSASLLIEIFLAYQIHHNIETVSKMILGDNEYNGKPWYFSTMFYTIVLLGFGVYMMWAYFLELMVDMHSKKDNGKVVKLKLNRLDEIIEAINKEISDLKTRVSDIEANIKKNLISSNMVKQMIGSRIYDKALLKRNIEQFYNGWLKHLSSADHLQQKIKDSETTYRDFLQSIEITEKPVNANLQQVLGFVILFVLLLCNGITPVIAQTAVKPMNVVVVLDLSDRLLAEGNFTSDSTVIVTAFNNFYRHVQYSNLYIKSNDCFKVVAAPQQGTTHALINQLEQFYLNMANVPMAQRKNHINEYKKQLPYKLQQLYKLANKGNKTTDYAGCDIWQYANEQLSTDVLEKYNNKVIVVTDGYMDFEDATHAMQAGKLYTHTHFIKQLSGNNWQQKAIGYGIIPIKKNWHHAQVLVVGFSSKQVKNLTELDKLRYFWQKWLKECGFGATMLVNNTQPQKMAFMVNDFFKQ